MKNNDRLNKMSIEEKAKFFHTIGGNSLALKFDNEYVSNEIEYIKQWLESEAEE